MADPKTLEEKEAFFKQKVHIDADNLSFVKVINVFNVDLMVFQYNNKRYISLYDICSALKFSYHISGYKNIKYPNIIVTSESQRNVYIDIDIIALAHNGKKKAKESIVLMNDINKALGNIQLKEQNNQDEQKMTEEIIESFRNMNSKEQELTYADLVIKVGKFTPTSIEERFDSMSIKQLKEYYIDHELNANQTIVSNESPYPEKLYTLLLYLTRIPDPFADDAILNFITRNFDKALAELIGKNQYHKNDFLIEYNKWAKVSTMYNTIVFQNELLTHCLFRTQKVKALIFLLSVDKYKESFCHQLKNDFKLRIKHNPLLLCTIFNLLLKDTGYYVDSSLNLQVYNNLKQIILTEEGNNGIVCKEKATENSKETTEQEY